METAEYVTTKMTQYAQVFVISKPVKLEKVGLALHKFGGDGQLWVDLYADRDGKPGRADLDERHARYGEPLAEARIQVDRF